MPERKRSIVEVQAIGSNSVSLAVDNRTIAITRAEARALAAALEEAAMECETECEHALNISHGQRRGRR